MTDPHHSSTEDYLARVQAIGLTILAERDGIERPSQFPAALIEALRAQGVFSLWLARDYAGPELDLAGFIRVIEALARHDASVAWCVSNAGGYSRLSGYLPSPVARDLCAERRVSIAGALGAAGRAVADIHTAAQHLQIQPLGFETGGRVLLGLEPGPPIF